MSDGDVDQVSSDLRAVERQIDSAYTTNQLMKLGFGEAVWHFFTFIEDHTLLSVSMGGGHGLRASIDNLVNFAKLPMYWLFKTCHFGEPFQGRYSDQTYQAAWDLHKLATEYSVFESVFTYASRGLLDLRLEGPEIFATGTMAHEEIYDAYDRLTEHIHRIPPELPETRHFERHRSKVKFEKERFWYPVSNAIVKDAVRALAPSIDPLFQLDPKLPVLSFTLADHKKVMAALSARCTLHSTARVIAAGDGCYGMGLESAVLIFEKSELVRKLTGDTGISGKIVWDIVTLLGRLCTSSVSTA